MHVLPFHFSSSAFLVWILFLCRIIQVCLSIWARSPKAYNELKACNMLKLPSGPLLRMYKNCVKQTPGFLADNLCRMMSEAEKKGYQFGSPQWSGGIAVDEMSTHVQRKISKCSFFWSHCSILSVLSIFFGILLNITLLKCL